MLNISGLKHLIIGNYFYYFFFSAIKLSLIET
jgi:hypothetical protein